MLKRLIPWGGDDPSPPPQVPEGRRVYAVGDIHGRDDLLALLLERIAADDAGRPPAHTQIVFLGDYVDRGPASCGVITRLMALEPSGRRCTFLMGNHEDVMLRVADGDMGAASLFDRIGGRETLISYGMAPHDYDAAPVEGLPELVLAHVPGAHLRWMQALAASERIGDYMFVHAGVRPRIPLDDQDAAEMRWIRGDFLDFGGSHGAIVVHGHSITMEVDVRPNRIGIDTGAFDTGRLTAIGLEGAERWFLQT